MSGYEIVFTQSASSSAGPKIATATCPTGKRVVGGGYATTITNATGASSSRPSGNSAWIVTATEFIPTNLNWLVSAYAVCVNAP